ncbi:hypothetical protein BV98_002203 [Sphingobium herbicidovorans NBRC 16415]|uniref:Uncharacterized protein n=1 Tax=Sphingobium herbicidovorans (strain ATCC 700291 / DSM 11019 / CCUG 56400 / KCTC 2939 / LMG 18315 / NBRC 16415 / MH) TaxID=1219045 RepID=A0A086P9G2_SPHHM|nr:hypothetical protein [Sphingobium herbicidovorans]KFG90030.1 hypothetical protein BV98_002203 [Sphingobium herbicidovorans NBRC 16415]
MARTFTREEFYLLVWSKPLTHLAKEFALSDVALHKICKKHDIPHPPLGWWAKKAAGKAVTQTPLPPLTDKLLAQITIAAGELRAEPELIAGAREKARILASAAMKDDPAPDRIVERTIAQLIRAKPNEMTKLAKVEKSGLIKLEVAPESAERLALALNRIAAVCVHMGVRITSTDEAAAFECDGEIISFSVTEGMSREKHVMTAKEEADLAAWEKKQAKRWASKDPWERETLASFSRPRFPEFDYFPTGQLSFELEQRYVRNGSPRRSFRDGKTQRLENMAADIAVGILVLAAAIKDDRLRREEAARREEEERQRREALQRAKHIEKRRSEGLEQLLEEVGSLDRLRRLVAALKGEQGLAKVGRVGEFVAFAESQLAAREAALGSEVLERRLTDAKLFGDDDDFDFRPRGFY